MLDLEQFEGHTPGPWWVSSKGSNTGTVVAKSVGLTQNGEPFPETNHECVLFGPNWNFDQHKPNAKLAAAAPALLAELRECRARLATAEAAIEKVQRYLAAALKMKNIISKDTLVGLVIDCSDILQSLQQRPGSPK